MGIDEEELRAATPDFEFFSKSYSSLELSDLDSKDKKIAYLEARIQALEQQLQPEETQSEKIIQFPMVG